MNWIQEFSTNKNLYDNLSSFLEQYGISGLEQALHLYRNTHQAYICKNRLSISRINIYGIYYLKISRHGIAIHTEQKIYHRRQTVLRFRIWLQLLLNPGLISRRQSRQTGQSRL